MAAVLEWAGDDEEPVPSSFPSSQHRVRGRRTPARPGELPPEIEAAIWRGNQLGSPVTSVVASGFPGLDVELPGTGWPCQAGLGAQCTRLPNALTEVGVAPELQPWLA